MFTVSFKVGFKMKLLFTLQFTEKSKWKLIIANSIAKEEPSIKLRYILYIYIVYLLMNDNISNFTM